MTTTFYPPADIKNKLILASGKFPSRKHSVQDLTWHVALAPPQSLLLKTNFPLWTQTHLKAIDAKTLLVWLMQKRIKILSEEESKCAQLYKLPIGQTQGCSGVNFPVSCFLVSPLPTCSNMVIRAGFIKNTHLSIYLSVYVYV